MTFEEIFLAAAIAFVVVTTIVAMCVIVLLGIEILLHVL